MRNATLPPFRELIGSMLDTAREAGNAILNVYSLLHGGGEAGLVSAKADGSPVSEADMRAHRIIAARLRELTPAVPVVSEEDAVSLRHRQPKGVFWLIDPLDGTKEFISGTHEFTVNIALIRDGAPVLGVVRAPALQMSYWGGEGIGAFYSRDGKVHPLDCGKGREAGICRVIASKSHMSRETEEYIASLGPCELVQAGSSLKFCRIAEGQADVYPRLGPTCEWDTAAAQAVVEAAGGEVVDMQGAPLRYGKPDVLNPYFIVRRRPVAE